MDKMLLMHSLFLIGYKGRRILNNAYYIYQMYWKGYERYFNLDYKFSDFNNSDVFSLFITATLRDDMEFEYVITFCLCKISYHSQHFMLVLMSSIYISW